MDTDNESYLDVQYTQDMKLAAIDPDRPVGVRGLGYSTALRAGGLRSPGRDSDSSDYRPLMSSSRVYRSSSPFRQQKHDRHPPRNAVRRRPRGRRQSGLSDEDPTTASDDMRIAPSPAPRGSHRRPPVAQVPVDDMDSGQYAISKTEPLPAVAWVYGEIAAEEENKENPIEPDEEEATRKDFCYVCEVAMAMAEQSIINGEAQNAYGLIEHGLAPLYETCSHKLVTRLIRTYYNEQVRPFLEPSIKQRWTLAQIYEHYTAHTHRYRYFYERSLVDGVVKEAAKSGMLQARFGESSRLNGDSVAMIFRALSYGSKSENGRAKR